MTEDAMEFTIPRESLGEYECAPGDKLTLEVMESDDEGIEVKVVGKVKAEGPAIVDDPELDAAFEKGM
jgi:hypothetical protein